MQIEPEHVKTGVDVISASAVIAMLAGWLTPVAALFTIIWTGIRIWETPTVQKLWTDWRKRP